VQAHDSELAGLEEEAMEYFKTNDILVWCVEEENMATLDVLDNALTSYP